MNINDRYIHDAARCMWEPTCEIWRVNDM